VVVERDELTAVNSRFRTTKQQVHTQFSTESSEEKREGIERAKTKNKKKSVHMMMFCFCFLVVVV
jgi:hypothetical protein